MTDHWLHAKQNLVDLLIAMGPNGLIQIQPPGGCHWTRILRVGREVHVEAEDSQSLSAFGLGWAPEQVSALLTLGWSERVIAGVPGLGAEPSVGFEASFGLDEAADLADAVVGLYAHAVGLDPRDPIWAWDGRTRTHLHSGEPGPINRTATGRLGTLAADNTDLVAFATTPVKCPECAWLGIGRDTNVCEFSCIGAELVCPQPDCYGYFGFSIFPWARTEPS